MKNFNNLLTLGILVLFLSGCQMYKLNSDDNASNILNNKQNTDTNIENLTNEKAEEMVYAAYNYYWFILNGGGSINGDIFEYEDITYRFMDEEYDTIEKLKKYYMEVFSEETVEEFLTQYLNSHEYIVYEGRLAEINKVDGMGTIISWDDAEAKLISKSESKRIYEFNVWAGEGYVKRKVEFVFEEERGWRISNSPSYFIG